MTRQNANKLMEAAYDCGAIDGGDVARIEMMEAADGSRRPLALVTTHEAGLEQTYRVILPAPASAPAWAQQYTTTTFEVRVGEGEWLMLDEDGDLADAYAA